MYAAFFHFLFLSFPPLRFLVFHCQNENDVGAHFLHFGKNCSQTGLTLVLCLYHSPSTLLAQSLFIWQPCFLINISHKILRTDLYHSLCSKQFPWRGQNQQQIYGLTNVVFGLNTHYHSEVLTRLPQKSEEDFTGWSLVLLGCRKWYFQIDVWSVWFVHRTYYHYLNKCIVAS